MLREHIIILTFLNRVPEFWGPWNHASLTSISKRNAEIKVGIRKGFAFKGILSLKKNYTLNYAKRATNFKEPGTIGVLLGNLIGGMWLRSRIYPKYARFLQLYLISHPRPLGLSFSNFLWEEMVKLGLCTLNQGDITVEYKKTIVNLKWKAANNHIYGIARRIKGTGKIQLETIGTSFKTIPEPSDLFNANFYKIKVFNGSSVHFSTDINASLEKIEEFTYEVEQTPSTDGAFKESVEALITIIGINSLKAPDRGWLTSLMRRFGVLAGGWSIYLWDNSFIGMMSTVHYPQLAKGNIEAICSELTLHGFLPNQANTMARSETISQLPITSYCALKVSKILNESINIVIQSLESNNNWWLNNRDPNRSHLLSYGSELKRKCTGALRQTAIYESGMDNHPMFDKISVDYESGCLAMYPVCLNSIYALDCLSLADLAKRSGNEEISNKLLIRYNNMKRVINKHLWDGETYRNRYWNGEFQKDLFPTYLFPLIAGVASSEQAEKTVKKIFRQCLTPFGIANSTIDHPSFKEQISWRGRLLPPIQFLVSESLRRYEFDLEASELARRCYRCFYKEWSEESHFHESYNGYNGEGDDVSITGEPGHPWAALLPYLAIQDFIDFEVWNGIRLGRLTPINASINDIPIQSDMYSVCVVDSEQSIKKNKQLILKTSYPAILRQFKHGKGLISFKSKSLKPCTLELYINPGNYQVLIGNESFKEHVDSSGNLILTLKELQNEVQIIKT